MRSAVIVSTARTPIGRAYRGAFNATTPQALAGHAIAQAVKRAGVEGAEVDDVILGAALQQGYQAATSPARHCCAPPPLRPPANSTTRSCRLPAP